jgi:hypothetical protein
VFEQTFEQELAVAEIGTSNQRNVASPTAAVGPAQFSQASRTRLPHPAPAPTPSVLSSKFDTRCACPQSLPSARRPLSTSEASHSPLRWLHPLRSRNSDVTAMTHGRGSRTASRRARPALADSRSHSGDSSARQCAWSGATSADSVASLSAPTTPRTRATCTILRFRVRKQTRPRYSWLRDLSPCLQATLTLPLSPSQIPSQTPRTATVPRMRGERRACLVRLSTGRSGCITFSRTLQRL